MDSPRCAHDNFTQNKKARATHCWFLKSQNPQTPLSFYKDCSAQKIGSRNTGFLYIIVLFF